MIHVDPTVWRKVVTWPLKAAWWPFKTFGNEIIKPILIRRWARQIANAIHHTEFKIQRKDQVSNVCGSGGHSFRPMIKSWTDIYDEGNTVQKVNWDVNRLSKTGLERLFFDYFGPLEAWCEHYLTGDFALWTDDQNVYLLLTHEYDQTYFGLKWGGKLPNINRLYEEFPS